MKTPLYSTCLFSADRAIYSFCECGSKYVTDKPILGWHIGITVWFLMPVRFNGVVTVMTHFSHFQNIVELKFRWEDIEQNKWDTTLFVQMRDDVIIRDFCSKLLLATICSWQCFISATFLFTHFTASRNLVPLMAPAVSRELELECIYIIKNCFQ